MTSEAAIALNRFGLGAKPGEIERLSSPQDWLLEKINATPKSGPNTSSLKSSKEHNIVLQSYFRMRRQGRQNQAAFDEDKLQDFRRQIRQTTIAGDWPGLRAADLRDQRDLAPANAVEDVLAGILRDHLGANWRPVIPSASSPFSGLIRTT